MKKVFLPLLFFILTIGTSFGQADTVTVPFDYGGSAFGSLQKFIIEDTLSNGEQTNPERYYELEKNKIYFLDGIFFADFPIKLIGQEVGEGDTPPIVASTLGADGVIQLIQFKFFDDAFVKDIIFQMTPPNSSGESDACFFLSGEDKNYEFDNVMIEWGRWTGMVNDVPVNKVVIKNCYFKNIEHKTSKWNGRGYGTFMQNPADSVIMQNNSFFNLNSFAFFADISSIPPTYFLFDHNTLVNSVKFPIHSFWLPNATVTNNIFFNTHSLGETAQDVVGQDPEGLKYGIINIDGIPSSRLAFYGIEESDRTYKVMNNGFFYEQAVNDYWTEYDLGVNPWMNERVVGMFADDVTYPGLEAEAPLVMDPGFINDGDGVTSMIQWMSNIRDVVGNTAPWGWDSDDDKFAVEWPVVEDLSYTNETMQTASEFGFPLGDLNWWGDEVIQNWKDATVGTRDVPFYAINEIVVAPSPASDYLTVNYNLLEKKHVQIAIYNIVGNEVFTLFEGNQTQGQQSVEWSINESLPNGIYLIRISDGIGAFTKKVVVQR